MMQRRTFIGMMIGTSLGVPFRAVPAKIMEGPSPILTYRDLLTAPQERMRLCGVALRLDTGDVIQGSGLRYVSHESITQYRRTFVFEDIITAMELVIEKTQLLDWDGRVIAERSLPGGRPMKFAAGRRLALGQAYSMLHRKDCTFFKDETCKCMDILLLGAKRC